MDRETLQSQAARSLEYHKRLMCMWATGAGKTMVALKFIQSHPGIHTLILVPESNNIQNWYDEFEKFGISPFGVEIACYASVHKFENSKWDFLVIDEAPHIDTDLKLKYLGTVEADYVLALGAVISKDEQDSLRFLFGNFQISEVSLDNCIAWGILPPPKVKILHIKLDDIPGIFQYDGRTLTARGVYDAMTVKVKNAVSAYHVKSNTFTENKMKLAGAERKRTLGILKDTVLTELCRELEKRGKRFICFCSTVKQAESLGKDNAFTSKSPVSFDHLNKFNNHEIDSLFVVGKCIEGQNLKDIECGIIGQIGGTQRITVQELGRLMRSTNPVVYIPVIDDTKDTSFLYSLTSSISKQYISHHYYKPTC